MKDAQEIFKDRPEAAKKLIEAVMRACGGCKIPIKQEDDRPKPKPATEIPPQRKEPILKRMKILSGSATEEFTVTKVSGELEIFPLFLTLQLTCLPRISQRRKTRLSRRKMSLKAWYGMRRSCCPKKIK